VSRSRGLLLAALTCICLFHGYGQLEGWRKRGDAVGLTVGLNPLDPAMFYAEGIGGGIIVSRDRGVNWDQWSDPGLTAIRQILVHPSDTSIVFAAASSGGLRRTTNAGSSWATVIAGFSIDGESIAIYDPDPDTIYAGNFPDGKVYRSTDRGATWSTRGISSNRLCALAVRPDNPEVLCAGTSGGTISRSTDGGVSWSVVKDGTAGGAFQEVPKIVFHPLAPLTGYATTYGSLEGTLDVWKTTDGGATWNRTALRQSATWSIAVDPQDPDIVYAGSFIDTRSTVYRTTDGGDHWTSLMYGLPPLSYMWSLKVHPADPTNVVLAATKDIFGALGIYRLLTASAVITGVLVDSLTGDTLTAGTVLEPATGEERILGGGDPFFSFGFFEGDHTDTLSIVGTSYPFVKRAFTATFEPDSVLMKQFPMARLAGATVSGVLVDSVSMNPVEGSLTLSVSRLIGDTTLSALTDGAGQFSFGTVYVTEPGVNDYQLLTVESAIPYSTGMLYGPEVRGDTGLTIRLNPADLFIVSAFDDGVFLPAYETAASLAGLRTARWNESLQGPAPMRRTVEFGRRVMVFYTADLADTLTSGTLDSLESAIAAGAHLFLLGQNLVEKNAATHLLADLCRVGFTTNTVLAYNSGIGGEILDGLDFFTTGPGVVNQTSRDVLAPLDAGTVPILDYGAHTGGTAAVRRSGVGDSSRVVVAGFGLEGIYTPAKRADFLGRVVGYLDGSVVTAVEDGPGGSPPSSFRLSGNYPNPFNPTTVIEADVPVSVPATLVVTNLLGQRVETLYSGNLAPGTHRWTWDATGRPSGVYLYTLTTPAFRRTGRMMLLR